MAGFGWQLTIWGTVNLLALFSIIVSVAGFNIDTKAPIVKQGSRDSYFGFSVSPHFIRNAVTADVTPVILVGAPRDNITDPDAPSVVRQLVRPGAVYQCPFTSSVSDCIPVKIDREAPGPEDDKNEQWMGVSVVSQGTSNGKALACAHRFRLFNDRAAFRWGLGQCVTLTNSLDENIFLQPCSGRDMNTRDGGFAYGFCQAGTSAAISKDSDDILLGAPGTINWRGTVFKNTFPSDSLSDSDSQWYQTPVEDHVANNRGPEPATTYYSYLGMSVKIANISGQKWYVGGAPRSNRFGQVLLFRPSAHIHNYLYSIEQQHVLTGFQFGASFGYDLAVGDFSGDGHEDLVVSAPFYHAHGTGGAIYVYYNSGKGITSLIEPQIIYSRKMKDAECMQLNCHDARFGLALAAIGDVDRDGFHDLAVGAPYEGRGAVYIFRGSSHGIIAQYSQRIYALDLFPASPIRSFGASLAGDADLDGNGYPDLVVGSFAAQSIALLRARPVINIRTSMNPIPERIEPKITQCAKDGSSNVCFEIRVCFMFTAEPRDRFTSRLVAEYQLDAEKLSVAKLARAMFPQKAQMEVPVMNGSILMKKQSLAVPECNSHLVYVSKTNRDFYNPIQFLLTYKLQDRGEPVLTPGGPIDDINNYPVINRAAAHANLSVDFAQDCGDDHRCNSSLSIRPSLSLNKNANNMYVLRVGQSKEMTLTVPVHNGGEDAHQALLTIELPESISFLGMAHVGQDITCSPMDNIVQCSLGNPLPGGRSIVAAVRLDVTSAEPLIVPTNILVTVNTTSIEADMSDNIANVSFLVIVETDLSLRGSSNPEQVMFGGVVLGESSVEFEDQIGSVVKHTYEVRNEGNISVSSSKLIVEFPYEMKSGSDDSLPGKHLLYLLTDPILKDGDRPKGYCNFDESWVNPLHIKSRSVTAFIDGQEDDLSAQAVSEKTGQEGKQSGKVRRRKRRDAGGEPDSLERSRRSKSVVHLDCKKENVKCRRIECFPGELVPGGGIALRLYMRLWNHTFIEDFAEANMVLIVSHAQVEIDSSLNIVQTNTTNDVFKLVTTALPDILFKDKEGVPLWIIIVAVIIGVLLLSLLIILLWKCGFFKRHRSVGQHQAKKERMLEVNEYLD